jgi:hypothetical protein
MQVIKAGDWGKVNEWEAIRPGLEPTGSGRLVFKKHIQALARTLASPFDQVVAGTENAVCDKSGYGTTRLWLMG